MGEPRETEIKLRLASVEAARESLRRIGARLVRERHFEDNVLFDDAAGSLRARGTVLRLRRTPHGAFLTFKGPRRPGDLNRGKADAAEIEMGRHRPIFLRQRGSPLCR